MASCYPTETLRISPIGAADTIRLPAYSSPLLASIYPADGTDQPQARTRPSTGGSSAAPLGCLRLYLI
jgi:hypothetical protein